MRFIFFFTLLVIIVGCKPEKKRHTLQELEKDKEILARVNKVLVEEDRTIIEGYIKRHKLDAMQETGTGLFYLVWGEPKGDIIKTGNIVEFNYKITLLDGRLCYQSELNNPKKFKVGQGGVESGLEQAVLLMHPGQKGKFILPPHLAYGLLGDEKTIPSRSIIVYDIEMLNAY